MFDSTKQFTVRINSGTRKECKVRFPSDAQWCARARAQRSIRHFLGRGKSKTTPVDSSAAALELFNVLRVDPDGAPFDAPEAEAVLEKLERTEVLSCEREGDSFRVVLKVFGVETEHVVRMPTRKEMDAYEAAAVQPPINQRRSQEIRGCLEPSGELYGLINKLVTGYEGGVVPIHHKAVVVSEVLAEIFADDEDPVPE